MFPTVHEVTTFIFILSCDQQINNSSLTIMKSRPQIMNTLKHPMVVQPFPLGCIPSMQSYSGSISFMVGVLCKSTLHLVGSKCWLLV